MIESSLPATVGVQRRVRPLAGPRTAAAMSETLERCGRLGPEHAALVDACAELEAENEKLREAARVLDGMTGRVPTAAEWRIICDMAALVSRALHAA